MMTWYQWRKWRKLRRKTLSKLRKARKSTGKENRLIFKNAKKSIKNVVARKGN